MGKTNELVSVSFRWYANKDKSKQVLQVTAKTHGTSNYVPRSINSFRLGVFQPCNECCKENWDKQHLCFSSTHPTAIANNALIGKIKNLLAETIQQHNPQTAQDLWVYIFKPNTTNVNSDTLGAFLSGYIEQLKYPTDNRLPSGNYRLFITLYNHLKRQDTIINKPIADITDNDFKAFGDYLLTKTNARYLDVMKNFKAVHRKAVEAGKASTRLTYKPKLTLSNEQRKKVKSNTKAVLSATDLQKFIDLDVSTLPRFGTCSVELMQLYKDTCLLMWGGFSRPIDVISWETCNVVNENGNTYIVYIPRKKANNKDIENNRTKVQLGARCKAIIEKYKGQSNGGYLLPYSINNKCWNMDNAKECHTRLNNCDKAEGRVNKWLKKVAKHLNITLENNAPLTMYTFRHTAITNAIDQGFSPMVVAKLAGTSVAMIEKTYYNPTSQMQILASLAV